MRILVSNDDGYYAEGLRVLVAALSVSHEVWVVAPDRNRSGASNSLTILHPLRPTVMPELVPGVRGWSVDGTPADCVHLALSGLMPEAPDVVVSGINHGANLGDDTLYSGTVAAAMEGRRLRYTPIAVSLVSHQPQHFVTAAAATVHLLDQLPTLRVPPFSVLNINVPDIADHKGWEVTRLGRRATAEAALSAQDPRGRALWWVGAAGPDEDASPGTDFFAVRQGRVSLTPLRCDLTHTDYLPELAQCLR